MKHLSHKLAASLLATSVTLSLAHADTPLLELPLFDSVDVTKTPVHKVHQPHFNSSNSIIQYLRDGEAQLEKALLSGAAAQDEVIALTKTYNNLKSQFDALSEETKKLTIENAALKIEQEKLKSKKQSTWQRFQNWIFKLDATKVATTIISGLATVICTLLVIIL
jgi:FtsZ-binding cell division protein ZapB